jgi:hypothetical protein
VRRQPAWLGIVGLFALISALICLYYSVDLGVTAEEGLKYNPDVTQHPAFHQMQLVADRWMWGFWVSFAATVTVVVLTIRAKRSDR